MAVAALVSSLCVAVVIMTMHQEAAAQVPVAAAKHQLHERRDKVAAGKAAAELLTFTQDVKQQLYSGGVARITAALCADASLKSQRDGTGLKGEIQALKIGLHAWETAEEEKKRNLISRAKFFLTHSLKEAKDAERADRWSGTVPEAQYEGEYDHAEETEEHALGHFESLEDQTNDLVATLKRHVKESVHARLAALQRGLSRGQKQVAEKPHVSSDKAVLDKAAAEKDAADRATAEKDAVEQRATHEQAKLDKTNVALRQAVVDKEAAEALAASAQKRAADEEAKLAKAKSSAKAESESAQERAAHEEAKLMKADYEVRHATIDKEAAEALAASAEKRAGDNEARLGKIYAALRHVAASREAAGKEAANAEASIQQRAAAKEAKLEDANAEEHNMKEILMAALALAMLLAVIFYSSASRLKRQNAHHVSAIMKLNTDRIMCMQKIKELTRPILEEGGQRASAQATIVIEPGTGGMETD